MQATSDDELRLDGNAAAGMLDELLSFDVTTAVAICDGCARASAIGELILYGREMGAVLRCPGCGSLLICVTRPGGAICVDLRGVRLLRVNLPS
jgi:hypothetical protein